MAFTEHGHHIEGSSGRNRAPLNVTVECGGPDECEDCDREATAWADAVYDAMNRRIKKEKEDEQSR